MSVPSRVDRRAEWLLRWYPRDWRARYGEEFLELLVAEIGEQPGNLGRTVDVAFSGLMARLAGLGLRGNTVDQSDRSRRCLATAGGALVVLLTFAVSMWSQLDIAERRADPTTRVTHQAIILMTIAVAVCLAATAIAAIPVTFISVVIASRRPELGLRRPVGLFVSATAVLAAGAVGFRHGWPGAHPGLPNSVGPGGVGGVLWAATIGVSAYWAHPSILFSLPVTEIAWMAVSSVAVAMAAGGATLTLRRIDVPPVALPFLGIAARVALAGLGLFVSGTLIWMVDGAAGPGNLFQAGTVDFIGLAVIGVALAVAGRAVGRASLTNT
jgi:hypothetical protein